MSVPVDALFDIVAVILPDAARRFAPTEFLAGISVGVGVYRVFRIGYNNRRFKIQSDHNHKQDEKLDWAFQEITQQGRDIRALRSILNATISNLPSMNIWEQLGLTEEQYNALPKEHRDQLQREHWTAVESPAGTPVLTLDNTPAESLAEYLGNQEASNE